MSPRTHTSIGICLTLPFYKKKNSLFPFWSYIKSFMQDDSFSPLIEMQPIKIGLVITIWGPGTQQNCMELFL